MNTQLAVAHDTRANLELAKAFADSKMVPDHFKKSVGDCYIAINLADRHGMDPWTLMQEMYIVNNRPMMSGKLAIAILNHSLAEPLRPEYSGEGDERTIVLTGRAEGDATPVSVTAKVKDAKTSNEQWKKNPDQMLMYFAARMWGRRYAPDILLGIVFDDEEIPVDTTKTTKARTPIAAPGAPGSPDHALARRLGERGDIIDQLTGEVLDEPPMPHAMPIEPNEKWHDWGKRFVTTTRTSPDIDTVDQWLSANADTLAACAKENPKVHGNIEAAIKQLKLDIMNQGEGS